MRTKPVPTTDSFSVSRGTFAALQDITDSASGVIYSLYTNPLPPMIIGSRAAESDEKSDLDWIYFADISILWI